VADPMIEALNYLFKRSTPRGGGLGSVPSMFGSLEVQILYTT
jgi:hypothetical protein